MQTYLLMFILGLGASEWFARGFGYWIFLISLAGLASFFLGFLYYQRCFRRFPENTAELSRWILILTAIFIFGFFYSAGFEKFFSWNLPSELIKKSVKVEGFVDSIPKQSERFSQFDFRSTKFNGEKTRIKLQLAWYNDAPILEAGEKCFFSVRLKPVHGLQNPGTFDFEKYLKSNGVRARGYVVSREGFRCENRLPWNYFILIARQKIQGTISKSIKIQDISGLIAALTVGSRTEMNPAQWKVLQNTGTSHLMAISGLHVAFIAGLIYFIVNYLWRLSPRLMRYFPAQKSAALISMFAAGVYGFLAGFSLPTQRAVIMIVVLISFEFFNKSTQVVQRLLWAAVIILIFQPLAISQVSFWLSFAAVAWICFGVLGYQKKAKWRLWLRIQWVCFLGLLPLTLFYFQQISLVTFLANAIAIPWVGFIIVPLCFLGSILLPLNSMLAGGLFWIIGYLFFPLWKILVFLSQLPFAVWQQSFFHPLIFISSMIAVILLLAPKAWPGRGLGFLFALPLFFLAPKKPAFSEVWLTVLDVGQGLATVIQTQHHALVYDAGPKAYGGFDSGEAVVLPFLRQNRIDKIDAMIISHGDNDHYGGAAAILSALPVARLLTSDPSKLAPFSAENCYEGESWTWDGVTFNVLNPPKNGAYLKNDSSCVLQIRAQGKTLLLPGDIEKAGEEGMLLRYPKGLEANVLLAPHHGSKTSSSEPFLSAVRPQYVLLANGFYNQFGFPSAVVLARYAAFHAKLFDTATQGALQVRVDSQGRLTVKSLKDK